MKGGKKTSNRAAFCLGESSRLRLFIWKTPCFQGENLGNFLGQVPRFLEPFKEIDSPGPLQSFDGTMVALVAGLCSILAYKFTFFPSFFSHIYELTCNIFKITNKQYNQHNYVNNDRLSTKIAPKEAELAKEHFFQISN